MRQPLITITIATDPGRYVNQYRNADTPAIHNARNLRIALLSRAAALTDTVRRPGHARATPAL